MTFEVQGRGQMGGYMRLRFTATSLIASGPQQGGWRCVWRREDFADLFGITGTHTAPGIVSALARMWGLRVRTIPDE